jgi:hypothetical protein
MQDNPYIATVVGALRYLVESGLWPFFVGFVVLVIAGCWLAPRDRHEVQFFD